MALITRWHVALVTVITVAILLSLPSSRTIWKVPVSSQQVSTQQCASKGWRPHTAPRKVWDFALMANELDFLEIRLNELKDVVDFFVIVESPTTFTGVEKPLYLRDNWSRFEEFHSKIVHQIVDARVENATAAQDAWQHEHYLRNRLLAAATEIKEGDIIMLSDLDELPRPEAVSLLRDCEFPDPISLLTSFHYYSYRLLVTRWPWNWHPQATVYRGQDTIPFDELRLSVNESAKIEHAGWHCSSCFSSLKAVLDKMEGFSHASEWNTPENRDPKTIIERFRQGLDLFGREEETYEPIEHLDAPAYVMANAERFRYLLDRSGEDGGFEDASEYI